MADDKKSRNGGKLVFHNYGDQYFLSEILCDSVTMNIRRRSGSWPDAARHGAIQRAGRCRRELSSKGAAAAI